MLIKLILIFLIAFIGSVLQNTIGFGIIIIMMAIMPTILPPQESVFISLVSGCVLSWWMLVGAWHHIDWKKSIILILCSGASVICGLLLVRNLSDTVYMKILAVLLVLLCIWMLRFADRVHIRASNRNGVIFGLLSGVMGALFAVGAPPLALYYSATTEDKEDYTACLQITLAIQTTLNICARATMKLIPGNVWLFCLIAVIGVVLGKFPGKWIYGKLNVDTVKKLIYIFIGIMGIYMFFSN